MQTPSHPPSQKPDLQPPPLKIEESDLESEYDVHFILDTQGNFTYISDNIAQFAQYKPKEVLGQPYLRFVIPEDQDRVKKKMAKILSGSICTFDVRTIRKDGRIYTIKSSIRPLWKDDLIVGMTGVLTDDSAKKKVEEALRDSQQQLADIIDFLPDATFAINNEGKIIIWNHAMEEITGCKSEMMLGRGNYEYAIPFYGEARPILIDMVFSPMGEVEKKYRSAKKQGDSLNAEVDARVVTGEIRVMWVKAIPLYDSRGEVVGCMEAIRDVNDFKIAEKEHKEHIHFLESTGKIDKIIKLANTIDQILWETAREILIIFNCDRVWFIQRRDPKVDSFSYTANVEVARPEYPGANELNIEIFPDEAERERIQKTLLSNEPITSYAEANFLTEHMKIFKIQSLMAIPILPKMGRPWIFGLHQCSYKRIWSEEDKKLFKEISRRINEGISSLLVLQELQENEERFRATFEQAAVGIAHVSFDGVWLRVNQKLCQIFGYSKAELLQKKFKDITHPDDLNLDLDLTRQTMQGILQTFSVEKRYYHQNGSLVWANLTVSMVRDANDKPAYFIYIIEDVTRRKQAESELILSRTEMAQLNKDLKAEIIERRKAEEENRQLNLFLEERVKDRTLQLEITNRELESFSYSVSHDLRAPLRSIDGFGQALLEDYGDTLDPVANGYLQKIRSSTRHMSNLIDDMLRLARVTRVEMQITRVDISLIANRILEDLQTTQPERLVKVVIPEKIMVKADQDLIEIVLDNLLRNAWKFTNKCPLASIEMGMTRIKEKEVYFVRDNGAGFDMAYVDKLFKSFERLHRVQEYEGTGIGLAIVKRIIQRHGGEVWAEGEVNKGATFYFSLP